MCVCVCVWVYVCVCVCVCVCVSFTIIALSYPIGSDNLLMINWSQYSNQTSSIPLRTTDDGNGAGGMLSNQYTCMFLASVLAIAVVVTLNISELCCINSMVLLVIISITGHFVLYRQWIFFQNFFALIFFWFWKIKYRSVLYYKSLHSLHNDMCQCI